VFVHVWLEGLGSGTARHVLLRSNTHTAPQMLSMSLIWAAEVYLPGARLSGCLYILNIGLVNPIWDSWECLAQTAELSIAQTHPLSMSQKVFPC
jgi:hypothetical protein